MLFVTAITISRMDIVSTEQNFSAPVMQIKDGSLLNIMKLMKSMTKILQRDAKFWHVSKISHLKITYWKLKILSLFWFFSVCEEFELATPCGSHSFCSESSGWAECSCEEGFEEDPNYSADRNGGAENATCSRIDPCRNYDCGNVINSFCVSINDEPYCQCEASFTTMKKNDSSDFYYETEEIYFTEDCLNIFCQSDNPCAVSNCSTISSGQVNIFNLFLFFEFKKPNF